MEFATQIGRGFIGIIFLVFVCYCLSTDRKAINWRLVITGIIVQLIFAIGILHVDIIRSMFQFLADVFVRLIQVSHAGTDFLFGNLAKPDGQWGYVFAIQVLPNIIFFAALSSILYYLGVLQKIVYVFAWLLSKLKISGSESLSTAANIFLGQTEAPLMVKPYLAGMTKSEILCIMVGGMANTAGSVLAAYVSFLGGSDPVSQKFYALHMLSQSIMSAPAAIVCAKMLFPQPKNEVIQQAIHVPKEAIGDNMLDAISTGTTDGLKLAVNVGAMLVVFTAVMAVLNYFLFKIGDWTSLNSQIAYLTNNIYNEVSLQMILGYLFAPVAWLIGVSRVDMVYIGQLLGEKTILNEFVAYISLGKMKTANLITDPRSIVIATYALCGFANFASIGIQIGGIGALAPNQRKNLTELGLRALVGGTIACLFTAAIAGMLI